MPVNLVSFSP